MEETIEVVIRVGLVLATPRKSSTSVDARLDSALRYLRRERYEVDLYIRGTWRRRGRYAGRKTLVLPETLVQTWKHGGGLIHCGEGAFQSAQISPLPRRNPPPEIVLRGVRRIS